MATALEAFRNENYLNLETFKKDGNGVKTPVWFVEHEGTLLVFTDGTSYKVKRLGRNPKARIAACDARGTVHGPWFDATAELVTPGDPLEARTYELLRKKYGFQYAGLTAIARLFGRADRRRVIAVRPV